jgi:hypothetical protein
MRRPLVLAPVLAAAAAATILPPAQGADFKRFFGTFVGRALESGPDNSPRQERDIDLVVRPEGKEGIALNWTNVTLVNGKRDVPGVKRRADEVRLVPAPNRQFFLARAAYDPFAEKRSPNVLAGDPLRWATVGQDDIKVYSLVVLDDGRYELQAYTRATTEEGMELEWQRIVDGRRLRHMTGKAVRAD